MFRCHSCLCIQKLLLAILREYIGCWELKLDWSHIRQAPYLLYYLSDLKFCCFFGGKVIPRDAQEFHLAQHSRITTGGAKGTIRDIRD